MNRAEEVVVPMLLWTLRVMAKDAVQRLCAAARKGGRRVLPELVGAGALSAGEARLWRDVARALVSAGCLRACRRCALQVVAPPQGATRCRRCRGRLSPGVLSRSRDVEMDAELERMVWRRLVPAAAKQELVRRVRGGRATTIAETPKRRAAGAVPARAVVFEEAGRPARDDTHTWPGPTCAAASAPPNPPRRRLVLVGATALALATVWVAGSCLDPRARSDEGTGAAVAARLARMAAAPDEEDYREQRRQAERALARLDAREGGTSRISGLWRGRFAWSQGRTGETAEWLGGGVQVEPADASALLAHGMAAWMLSGRRCGAEAARDLSAAEHSFRRLCREFPGTAEARTASAMVEIMAGRVEPALKRLGEVVREPGAPWETHWVRLWVRVRTAGWDPRVAEEAEATVRAHPWCPQIRVAAALARLRQQESGAARARIRAALELWPELADGWVVAAVAELQAGAPAAALPHAERAVQVDPQTRDAHLVRARTALALDDPCGAVVALTRVLSLDPDAGDALARRGRLYLSLGQRTRGERDLKHYLDRFPNGAHVEAIERQLSSD